MGGKVVTFETIDRIVSYSSELGFNDIKFPFACGEENIYFMIHQKYISIQEYKNSAGETSITVYIKKIVK